MAPRFHPSLINNPFGDPGLYIDFMFERRAIMFDLGDNTSLSSRKLLKLTDVFVSHMHMDHFCGLDHLLRLNLGRDKNLRIFGPSGIIDAVEHKLLSYTWNLVENYKTEFEIVVTEVMSAIESRSAAFRTSSAFQRIDKGSKSFENGVVLEEPSFLVQSMILDHGIPVLAFALEEKNHINILKKRLEEMGLQVGPWLNDLKTAILDNKPDQTPYTIFQKSGDQIEEKTFLLEYLKDRVTVCRPGQKIAYVVDIAYSPENKNRVQNLIKNSSDLFIESRFLDVDADRARIRNHLTARQAGIIARSANVKRLTTFHYSPLYKNQGEMLEKEAQLAFKNAAF